MTEDTPKTGRRALQSRMAPLQIPHDPARMGIVGKGRRAAWSAAPDPEGNRAERRAAARQKTRSDRL